MMDLSKYQKRASVAPAGSEPLSWYGQVAQTPQMTTEPIETDYEPINYQGTTSTTEPAEESYDWTAEDLMTYETPEVLQQSFGVSGGEPVSFADFDVESMKALFPQLATEDLSKQLMEQAGMGGTRWSSVLGQKIADATARAKETWAADMFAKWIGSQEAAKQRGLSAGISSAGNALQKAMFEAQLPMQIASAMSGMAGEAQEAETGTWGTAYQDWLRTTPESAMGTYGNAMLSLLGQEPGGATQYEPGWASQLMGVGSSLLPFTGSTGSDFSSWYNNPYKNISPISPSYNPTLQ